MALKRFPLCRRGRDEQGATAIVVTFLALALFAACALAVDYSNLVMERQKLHDHIDSAAHAGAFELPSKGSTAAQVAYQMAVDQDPDISPDASLYCVVGSTGETRQVRTDQIPATCNPGGAPYTESKYPGLRCNETICAIPCSASSLTMCNTIEVVEDKNVPFGFGRILGVNSGQTGAIASAACKGSCGHELPNPLDVVIMADRTASMKYNDRQLMKSAILESLKTMNPEMHYVAFGALHKSRTTGHTTKANSYGPQTDDYVVTANTSCTSNCADDVTTKLNYNGHWDGTGDTNGDGRCMTEAYTKAAASTSTPITKWTSSKRRPEPGMGSESSVKSGTWVPVPFSNNYLVGPKESPSLNGSDPLVDGVSCLSQSMASEYGTHLAGALKGAVRYALDNNPNPNRAGNVKVKKVVIFETDGMPDEYSTAFGNTSLTSGDLGGPGQSGGGAKTCQNFLDVANKAKNDEGILLITIGFGDAATKKCRKDGGTSANVKDVLAAAASPTAGGTASTAGDCSTAAGQQKENTDGDYFFCSSNGSELADIFKTAISQVSNRVRLIKMP